MVGWVQVETDDVSDLLDEERIGRNLEAAAAVRLQGEGLKQPVHGRLGNTASLSGLADAPVGGASRLTRQGPLQQSCDLLVIDATRPAGTQLVVEPRQAVFNKSLSPLADGGLGPVQATGNLAIALALNRPQHQPGARY